MAKRFVNQLEAIQVDHEQCQLGAIAGGGEDRLPGPLAQQAAVGEPGERIARRQLLDARLVLLAHRDVGAGAAVARPASLAVVQWHSGERLPEHAARAGDHPVHEPMEWHALAATRGEPGADRALFAERQEFPHLASEELGARIADQRLDALGEIRVAPVGVGLPDVFVGDRGDVAEALVGHTRRVFRVLARSDVGDDARHAPGLAVG